MIASNLSVIDAGESLGIALDDGRQRAIAVATLWAECPGALARRRRLDGRNGAPRGLKITQLTDAGYGIHIAFSSDAHGGVFPWAMLLDLVQRPQIDDFITPHSGAFTEDRTHGRDRR